MKPGFLVLALGVAFAASATLAKADTIQTGSDISVNGNNFSYNVTDPNNAYAVFAANGTAQGNYQVSGVGLGSNPGGTFSLYFSTPNSVTFFPTLGTGPFNLPLGSQTLHSVPTMYGPLGLEVFTTMQNGETLSFYLTQEAWQQTTGPGGYTNLSITGFGTFYLTGAVDYTPETASFNFTPQGTGPNAYDVSFSSTGTALGPVPEPSSLALLGTGLLGAALLARRRFANRLSA